MSEKESEKTETAVRAEPAPLLTATREELHAAAVIVARAVGNTSPEVVIKDGDLYAIAGFALPASDATLTPDEWTRVEIADLTFKSAWREHVLRNVGRLAVRVVGTGYRLLLPAENISVTQDDALAAARKAFAKARHVLKWTRDDFLDGAERQQKAAAQIRIAALDNIVKQSAELSPLPVAGTTGLPKRTEEPPRAPEGAQPSRVRKRAVPLTQQKL